MPGLGNGAKHDRNDGTRPAFALIGCAIVAIGVRDCARASALHVAHSHGDPARFSNFHGSTSTAADRDPRDSPVQAPDTRKASA